jgi:hypothetical protein
MYFELANASLIYSKDLDSASLNFTYQSIDRMADLVLGQEDLKSNLTWTITTEFNNTSYSLKLCSKLVKNGQKCFPAIISLKLKRHQR